MRQLIIDGNAVYELDENCMLTKEATVKKDEQKDEKNVYGEENEKRS